MSIEQHKITDRESWLKLRKADVTASAASALLGVHKFITPLQLYLEKTGKLEDADENAAMKRGRLIEPMAVQVLKEDHPEWTFGPYPRGIYCRDTAARIGCTPDLLVRNEKMEPGVIQIKSVEGSIFRKEWRDPATGDITPPLYAAVQAIIEAHLTGATWAAVAAVVVGHGVDLHLVPVPIHAGVLDRVYAAVKEFWAMVERGQMPPADYARDGEALSQLYAQVGTTEIDLTSDNRIPVILEEREKLSAEKKTADARLQEIKAELIDKLKGNGLARCAGWLITAKTINKKGYAVGPTSYVDVRPKRAITGGI